MRNYRPVVIPPFCQSGVCSGQGMSEEEAAAEQDSYSGTLGGCILVCIANVDILVMGNDSCIYIAIFSVVKDHQFQT